MAEFTVNYTDRPWQAGNYKVTFVGPQRSNYSIVYFPSLANMLEFAQVWASDPPLFQTSIASIEQVASEKDENDN